MLHEYKQIDDRQQYRHYNHWTVCVGQVSVRCVLDDGDADMSWKWREGPPNPNPALRGKTANCPARFCFANIKAAQRDLHLTPQFFLFSVQFQRGPSVTSPPPPFFYLFTILRPRLTLCSRCCLQRASCSRTRCAVALPTTGARQ